MKTWKRGCLGLLIAGLACAAQADEPKPEIVAGLSMAPLDRLDGVMKKAGFDGYRNLMLGIFEDMPLMGKGAMDTSRPAQIYMVDGDGIPAGLVQIMMLPVQPGTCDLDKLRTEGWKAFPDHTDTVFAPTGFGVRRTSHYLLMGKADLLVRLAEASLADAFRDESILFHAGADLRAMRNVAPKKFNAILDSLEKYPEPGASAAFKPLIDTFRNKIDRVNMVVSAQEQTAMARITVQPLAIPAPIAKYAKPSLPQACFAKVHLVCPAEEGRKWVAQLGEGALRAGIGSAAERKKLVGLIDVTLPLVVGDMTSLGFAWGDKHIVAYSVMQNAKPVDVDATVARLEEAAKALQDPQVKDKVITRSSYQASGKKITRLALSDGGPFGFIDLASDGNRLLATFSLGNGRFLPDLMADKEAGSMAGFLDAELNVGLLAKAMKAAGEMPPKDQLVPFNPENAGTMTLSGMSEGESVVIELRMPLSFIGLAMKAAPLK